MKTVVITGSARGLGLEMAKVFRENNLIDCEINDIKYLLRPAEHKEFRHKYQYP